MNRDIPVAVDYDNERTYQHSPPVRDRITIQPVDKFTATPVPAIENRPINREHNIPIQQTHRPAPKPAPIPLGSRYPTKFPSDPAERVPFLPKEHTVPVYDTGADPELALIRAPDMSKEVRPAATTWQGKLARVTKIRNIFARDFLAEFLGSFILIVFGNGAVAQVVLSKGNNAVAGDFFSINVAYGLAVGFGVYVAGGVSGGHLNPAVTLAFALKGALKWVKVPIYWLAQYLGCFVGSAVIYIIYYDAQRRVDQNMGEVRYITGLNGTAGIYASYPQDYLGWGGGLVDQIFATSFLMLGILALTDERNMGPHKGVVPILVGLLVTAIGLSYGFNCGYPINPARDLGPRIFTSMAGWGLETFSYRNHSWFWVPIVGPHLGALLGLGLYQLFIGNQWPAMQRTGIELQVVRKADEYELVKASHLTPHDTTVPVSFRTDDEQTQRLLHVR